MSKARSLADLISGGATIEASEIADSTITGGKLASDITINTTGTITGTFAGNITGDVTGNADTATALETARTIAGQSFDGSSNITIASTDLSNTSDITLLTSTQTLTNKTLTSPVISTISNTGTLTLPTSTDTLVGRDTTDTLTNKTLTSPAFSGTATNFTSTGIDDNATNTAITIDSSQNVSFNDDTGNTEKLIWNATDESLRLKVNPPHYGDYYVAYPVPRIGSGGITTDVVLIIGEKDVNVLRIQGRIYTPVVPNVSSNRNAFIVDIIYQQWNGELPRFSYDAIHTGSRANTADNMELGEAVYDGKTYYAIKIQANYANLSGVPIYFTGGISNTTDLGYLPESALTSFTAVTPSSNDSSDKRISAESIRFKNEKNEDKMLITTGGDISFYEDTGTTPKFFWDASAERLGIGTASPTQALDVNGLSYPLVINSTNGNLYKIQFKDNGVNRGYIGCGSTAVFSFANASASELMRIDSSGNVLVGTTSITAGVTSSSGKGISLRSEGYILASIPNDSPLVINRQTSDGNIAQFRKDGITVGTIGNNANNLVIDGTYNTTKSGLEFQGNAIVPRQNLALSDNDIALGTSSNRFTDLYLGGGLYVGGTGTANKLDDYEEGDFTPNITQGLSSITYVFREGHYTKIGRIVHFGIKIETSARTADSNRLEIGDLPFTTATSFDNPSQGAQLSYVDDGIVNSTTTNAPVLWIPGNQNKIVFYNTAGSDFTGNNLANSNAVFYINGVYQTT